MLIPIILLVLLLVILGWGVVLYNKLVRLKNTMQSAWADIDVQLKKRYDLVPNLVETVKGYAGHEKALLEQVTAARGAALAAGSPGERGKAENQFADTLKSLFAVAEAYPDLKASANFQQLQGQLKELEDTIEYARRYYNAVVRDFNTLQESFPANLLASRCGFTPAEFFELEAPAAERQPVAVSFS